MTSKELEEVYLPKWPAMLVVGKRVSMEQAMAVIVRTSGLYFSSNTHEFDRQLNEAVSISDSQDPEADHEAYRAARKRYRVLDRLEYLENRQIVSAYIGGPHGWINWDGLVATSPVYNIGKYPSVSGVLDEWKIIAEAFPFLDLRCQLFSGEQCEDELVPVVEYVVKDGKARAVEISDPMTLVPAPMNVMRFRDPCREIGCTIDLFRTALGHAEKDQ